MIITEFIKRFKTKRLYRRLGSIGRNTLVELPCAVSRPARVFIGDFSQILGGSNFIIYKGKFTMGKYCIASSRLTVSTDNHTPAVGLPMMMACSYHANDRSAEISVGDDCWLGANVTLINGCKINRGRPSENLIREANN